MRCINKYVPAASNRRRVAQLADFRSCGTKANAAAPSTSYTLPPESTCWHSVAVVAATAAAVDTAAAAATAATAAAAAIAAGAIAIFVDAATTRLLCRRRRHCASTTAAPVKAVVRARACAGGVREDEQMGTTRKKGVESAARTLPEKDHRADCAPIARACDALAAAAAALKSRGLQPLRRRPNAARTRTTRLQLARSLINQRRARGDVLARVLAFHATRELIERAAAAGCAATHAQTTTCERVNGKGNWRRATTLTQVCRNMPKVLTARVKLGGSRSGLHDAHARPRLRV